MTKNHFWSFKTHCIIILSHFLTTYILNLKVFFMLWYSLPVNKVHLFRPANLYCFFIFFATGNAQVAALGCLAIATIVLRQPSHCSVVMENNGHHVIVQAMKVHPSDANVQVCIVYLIYLFTYFTEFSHTIYCSYIFHRIFTHKTAIQSKFIM